MPSTPEEWLEEFLASVSTNAFLPHVTQLADSRILVSWDTTTNTGVASPAGPDIVGQIFDVLGNPIGNQFLLNGTNNTTFEDTHDVAALPSGGFLVVYQDDDGFDTDIRLTEFDANGNQMSQQVVAPGGSGFDRLTPEIAVSSNTSALAVYEDTLGIDHIDARLYNSDTNSLGTVTSLATGNAMSNPQVSIKSNGDYIITAENGTADSSISMWIVDATTGAVDVFFANVGGTDGNGAVDSNPDIARSGGNFVVVWQSDDGTDSDIFYQRFNSSGNQQTGAIAVTTSGNNDSATVESLSSGGFIVAWRNQDTDSIEVQAYSSFGFPSGPIVTIDTGTFIGSPELEVLEDGRIMVTWTENADAYSKIIDYRDNPNTTGDHIVGTVFADFIVEAAGVTRDIYGWDGNDFVTDTDGQSDAGEVFDAGAGLDIFAIDAPVTNDVVIDLSAGTYQGGTGGVQSVLNFVSVTGGAGDDALIGDSNDNDLNGFQGDDLLAGGYGEDTIDGVSGSDTVSYANDIRDVTVDLGAGTGEASATTLDVQSGTTTAAVLAAAEAGNIYFNVHSSAFPGGEIRGQVGAIRSEYMDSSGTRTIVFHDVALDGSQEVPPNGSLAEGVASLVFTVDAAGNVTYSTTIRMVNISVADITVSHFHEAPAGSNGGVVENLLGDPGATLSLVTETDTLEFIDNIIGSQGDDDLTGNSDDNIIDGGLGLDMINGAAGEDTLSGQNGNDVINGNAGDDLIFGGNGNDSLSGEDGSDDIRAGDGDDVVNGGAGDDTLRGQNDDDTLNGGANNDTLLGGLGDDVQNGDEGNDTLNGQAGNDTLNGGAGVDDILGASGDDIIDAGSGNDMVNGNGGDDNIDGGIGDDDLRGAVGFDTVDGGDGADTISGGNQNDTLNGDAGNDMLNGDAGNDIVNGGTDDDTLIGASGQDVLNGESGNDVLSGDAGGDDLFGGGGNDILNGGGDNDDLYGGTGVDTFQQNLGFKTDRIYDFEDNIDKIDFSANSLANNIGDVLAAATQVGANVRIDLNANNILVLENFNLADLDASDFIF